MTRTWLAVPGARLFAAAGVWRRSQEWGDCFAMVITQSAGSEAAAVHSRMPVLLAREDQPRWLAASPGDALELSRPWVGDLVIERTDESWARRSSAAQAGLL